MHRIATRHPLPTIFACLGLLALGWAWTGPPTFNSSAHVIMQGDQRNLTTYTELRETLDGLEIIAAVVEPIDPFSNAAAARLDQITRALAAVDGMTTVTSLTTPDRPARRGLTLINEPFIPHGGAPDDQWPIIRRRATSHLIARNLLVSDDGGAAMVLATNQRPLDTEAQRSALRHDLLTAVAPFPEVSLISYAVADGAMRQAAKTDARRFVPAAAIALLLTLLITFRRPQLVAAMLGNQLIVLAALPVLLRLYTVVESRLLGGPVPTGFDLYSNMLLPLTAAIQLALQVHVVAAIQQAPGPGRHDRIATGVRAVTRPTLIAAFTTILGLGSLALCDIAPVTRFALVGAASITLAAAHTLGPGLALIHLALPASPRHRATAAPAVTDHSHRRCLSRWAWPVALILLALLPGLAMIRTDVRAIEFLDRTSDLRRTAELIDARFGGINLFMIEFIPDPAYTTDTTTAAVNDPALLRLMADRRKAIAAIPGVGIAYDYSQAFALVNRVWHGDDPAHEQVPGNPVAHRLIAGMLDHLRLPFIEKLRTAAGDRAYMLIRTANMPSRDYLALLERIVATATADLPPGITVRPRMGLHTVLEQDRRLLANQARSAGLTLLAVAVLASLIWRAWWITAAMTITTGLPVLAMLGLAGYTDTSINAITLMAASIVLGLAIDDAAHLIDASLHHHRAGLTWRPAVSAALREKRRPIICTSVILGTMLGLFGLSAFPPVRAFGLLACAALLAALATVLALLPGLLRLSRRAPGATAEPD